MPVISMYGHCLFCDQRVDVKVDTIGFTEWKLGKKLIQHALPNNTADEREFLISQICPTCFTLITTPEPTNNTNNKGS